MPVLRSHVDKSPAGSHVTRPRLSFLDEKHGGQVHLDSGTPLMSFPCAAKSCSTRRHIYPPPSKARKRLVERPQLHLRATAADVGNNDSSSHVLPAKRWLQRSQSADQIDTSVRSSRPKSARRINI